MTKKDIVKAISADVGMPQLAVKDIVQKTFDEIVEALIRDGKIELRNFGVFKVTRRAARPARNPRTNEKVYVPEKCVVTFKPGKEMQSRVGCLTAVPLSEPEDVSTDTGVTDSIESSAPDASSPAPAVPPQVESTQLPTDPDLGAQADPVIIRLPESSH